MWTPPIIETERLILRPITMDDVPAIFAYASNPMVSRYVPWRTHRTPADSEAFVRDFVLANYEKEIPEPWGVTIKTLGDKIVGTVGCMWISKPWKTMELGGIAAEPMWGRGYAYEASRAAIDHVYRHYDVNRIFAKCHTANIGSARVMEKLGMKCEGLMRACVYKDDQFIDMYCYSILRLDWEGRLG